jgi:hypothetical protein
MKTKWAVLAAMVMGTAATSFAGGGFHVGVYVGGPVYGPAPVVVAPAPVFVQPGPVYVQPAPVYAAPPVVYGGAAYVGAPYGPAYVAPRGRVWVPGYWVPYGHGRRYVAGYWRHR